MNKQPPTLKGPATLLGAIVALAVLGIWLTGNYSGDAPLRSDETGARNIADDAESTRAGADTREAVQQGDRPDIASAGQQEAGTEVKLRDSTQAQSAAARDRELSAAIGRTMTEVIELLNADNFVDARAKLDELMQGERMASMTPFERSRLYQLSFNLNMQDEAYEAAQADLQAALESGGLNPQETAQTEYQVGQLYVQMEDYEKAADSLELWIERSRTQPDTDFDAQPNPAAYYLLAASYYYQERYDDARDHMETMMSMPGEKQEAWYSMMAALYLQNEDFAKAKPVVEKMVELYDSDRYRTQLRDINARLGSPQ